MNRNLYDIIENSDLNMRSRIDLKKEIRSNKITDENALLIRIGQKKGEELKQVEEKLNNEKKISSTSHISNKSELKLKIEDEDYIPTKKELYSYVINSKTNQIFKDQMKKELSTTNDYRAIIQKVKNEEKRNKLILIVNKSDLLYSSKREIINQIRIDETTTKESVTNRINEYKIIEKEREKDEIKRKKRTEEKKMKKERENLIFKVNYSSLNYFSKKKLIEEVESCKNPDLYPLSINISSELKKENLYSYVDSLNIFAEGSEINYRSKVKLKNQIYEGKLLTKKEIDDARNKLIEKQELNKIKRKKPKKSYHMNYDGLYDDGRNFSYLGGWER